MSTEIHSNKSNNSLCVRAFPLGRALVSLSTNFTPPTYELVELAILGEKFTIFGSDLISCNVTHNTASREIKVLRCRDSQLLSLDELPIFWVAIRQEDMPASFLWDWDGEISLGGALGSILNKYLCTLDSKLPEIRASELDAVASITIDMLNSVFEKSISSLLGGPTSYRANLRQKADAYISANLTDSELTIEQICAVIGTSRRSIYRLYKQTGGVKSYITAMRILKAEEILRCRHISMDKVAFQVGFSSISSFRRAYKKNRGRVPGDRSCIPPLHDSYQEV